MMNSERPAAAWPVTTRRIGLRMAECGSHLPLDHHALDLGDGLGRVEALRAGLGAVHDGVAAVEAERILELVEALAGGLVAAVLEPAVGLQQRRRAEEAL